MTKHYENLKFMAQLKNGSPVSRRLLRKFARMGMFYQRIRRHRSCVTWVPVVRIGDNRLSAHTRTLYSTFDLSYSANFLLAIVNEIIPRKELITREELNSICATYSSRIDIQMLRTVRYPFGWRPVRFAIFSDNQCVIIELGNLGYEIIGYYIKASYFVSIDCIPKNYLPNYRNFSNFL